MEPTKEKQQVQSQKEPAKVLPPSQDPKGQGPFKKKLTPYEEKREAIASDCRLSLKYLCLALLNMDQWQSPLHDDLSLWLRKQSGKQKLILMPRGHLKTSIITVGYTIWKVINNPNIRILITNAVWDNARMILNQIGEFLTYKSALPVVFGPFQSPRVRWTQDEIEIDQRTTGLSKEATITTAGVETAKTGSHYDLIIHDDLVERNNVSTVEQRKKVITFYRDSLDLLDPGGEMIVVGTRWALGDLYGHLLETNVGTINRQVVPSDGSKTWRDFAVSA